MEKVVILGSTGMLGNAVRKVFLDWLGEENVRCSKRGLNIDRPVEFQFEVGVFPHRYDLHVIPDCDWIINCIGVIKPHVEKDIQMAIMANASFPHRLAAYCEEKDIKLINITTDCVYSGDQGRYTELDLHDCLDAYGKTKSLGEPANCMNLRTSIIGPEIDGRATSLVEIVKQAKGKEFKAFTNWYWNGMTTQQYGKVCKAVIQNNRYEKGTFHVFSDTISKGWLIHTLNAKYDLGINITDCEAPYFCDRTLGTTKTLCHDLNIPDLKTQIEEM